jgi:hypothetical protein
VSVKRVEVASEVPDPSWSAERFAVSQATATAGPGALR